MVSNDGSVDPRRSLFAAVNALLKTWDTSADDLGPEWNGLADRIEAVRSAMPRHSHLWWYFRLRRAYRKHGVLPYSRRKTWAEAGFSHRRFPPERCGELKTDPESLVPGHRSDTFWRVWLAWWRLRRVARRYFGSFDA